MHPLKMVIFLIILFIDSTRGFPSPKTEMVYQKSTKLNEVETSSISSFSNVTTSEHQTTEIEDRETGSLRFRNRRAVPWRIPALRIPFLTRVRPQVSIPRLPGMGPSSVPIPKGGPKLGAGSFPTGGFTPKAGSPPGSLAGAGSPPQLPSKGGTKLGSSGTRFRPKADGKSRPKEGSKGPVSFPDFDDLPSPLGSDFFGGSSATEKDTGKTKGEDTANKTTTTERISHKWERPHVHRGGPEHFPDSHFHPEGSGHFPDYGWHAW